MNKANSFNKEELIACGHGKLFGPNSLAFLLIIC